MTFEISVHPSVFEAIETLPALTRTQLITLFSVAKSRGLTSLFADNIHWSEGNVFTLTVCRTVLEENASNGAIAKGFYTEEFDGTFYIRSLHRLEGGKCVQTGRRIPELAKRATPKGEDTADYIALDRDWFIEKRSDPFEKRASENQFQNINQVPITTAMEIEKYFYGDMDQILRSKSAELKFRSKSSGPDCIAEKVCYRAKFDANSRNKLKPKDLTDYVLSFEKWPRTLVLVNFTDELDPLSVAQRELINLVVPYLRRHYPEIKVQIIDVSMRNVQGARPYDQEFQQFYSENKLGPGGVCIPGEARPFTMVLGEPWVDEGEHLHPPASDYRRLFDIDLFEGCRGEAPDRRTQALMYKTNLRKTVHELFRCAGLMAEKAQVRTIDLRGRSRMDTLLAVVDILHAVIVIVEADADSIAFEAASRACCHAMLEGYPYVALVLQDALEHGDPVTVLLNNGKGEFCPHEEPRDLDAAAASMLTSIKEAYLQSRSLSFARKPIRE